jgi:hypothetical protein
MQYWLVFVFVLFQAFAGENAKDRSELCILRRKDIESILMERTGDKSLTVRSIGRNYDGSVVYVVFGHDIHANDSVAIISSDGKVKFMESPGRRTILDAKDNPICWVRNRIFHVAGRTNYPLILRNRFAVAPNGRAICLRGGSGPFRFFTTNKAMVPLDLPEEFFASRVFESKDHFLVSGYVRTNYRAPGAYSSLLRIYTITSDGNHYRIIGHLDLLWAGAVIDITPDGKTLLVEGNSDVFAKWFLYNTSERKKMSLGFDHELGVFLRRDTAKAVKDILKDRKHKGP